MNSLFKIISLLSRCTQKIWLLLLYISITNTMLMNIVFISSLRMYTISYPMFVHRIRKFTSVQLPVSHEAEGMIWFWTWFAKRPFPVRALACSILISDCIPLYSHHSQGQIIYGHFPFYTYSSEWIVIFFALRRKPYELSIKVRS